MNSHNPYLSGPQGVHDPFAKKKAAHHKKHRGHAGGRPAGSGQQTHQHPVQQAGLTPVQQGPPVDPTLMAQQAGSQLNVDLGNVWDTYQRGQLNAQYGNLNNPAADAVSNPYSQAALAFKRYNESQAGTTNSYAASGQLYSGALQRASEANASNYSQSLYGLRQQRQGAMDSLTQGAMSRYSQAAATGNTQSLQSILRALGLSS